MQRVTSALVLVALLSGGALAHADDFAAASGSWPMRDGCPARTGACATPPIVGELAPAWHFQPKGRLAGKLWGPPRVHGQRIAVAVRVSDTVTNLYVLRLGDGQPVVPPAVLESRETLTDIDLIFDQHGLVVMEQRATSKLSLWRIGRGKLRERWSVTAGRFTDMLRVGERIIAMSGSQLFGYDTTRDTPVWTGTGSYYGRLAAADGTVYALRVDEPGNAELVAHDALSGREHAAVFIGVPQFAGAGRSGLDVDITVTPKRLFVHSPSAPFMSSKKEEISTSILERDRSRLTFSTLRPLKDPVIGVAGGWITREDDRKVGVEIVFSYISKKDPSVVMGSPLANSKRHARYARGRVPLTTTGTVVYAGMDAFDVESREILREDDQQIAFRPIPARRTLLVAPDRTKLVAMRSASALRAGGVLFQDANGQAPTTIEKGVVAFSSGDSHSGAYRIEGDEIVVVSKKGKEKRHPLGGVRIATSNGDRVVYVHALEDLPGSLRVFMEASQANDYYKLVKDAYKAKNTALMRRWIEVAYSRGIDDKKLRHPRKQIGMLDKRSAKPNAKNSAKLEAREKALQSAIPALIDKSLDGALEDQRPHVRESVLRMVLARSPTHARAIALVTGGLPDWLRPKPPFDPMAWLELGEALAETPVERLLVPEKGELSIQQRLLGQARLQWRKDLVGMQSNRLLVFTPLSKPGRITRCISMGELVCTALESMFAHGKNVRTEPWPMVLHLFETKKAYLKAAGGGRSMEWSSGHFDPSEGVSRIYLPDRKDAFESVMRTYAHELTHHWISERCPLFTAREKRSSFGQPGYWIVEGMADFVESFRWDMGAQSWDTFNRYAEALDILTNAPPRKLHPWDRLFHYSHAEFARIPKDDEIQVPSRWKLGMYSMMSKGSLFYHQSAAAVHYLYHSSAETRASLIRFVQAYYTGKVPKQGDVVKHFFGVDSDTLGRRVQKYAREVVEGKRTK